MEKIKTLEEIAVLSRCLIRTLMDAFPVVESESVIDIWPNGLQGRLAQIGGVESKRFQRRAQ